MGERPLRVKDPQKEFETIDYLMRSIEKRWGRAGMQEQADRVAGLITELNTRGARFDRDWAIDLDEVSEKVFDDVTSCPFLSPFSLYCVIAPEDIESRKIISRFITPQLEEFFYHLATFWVAKASEQLGYRPFTCDVICMFYDLWSYYRWVDAKYEAEKRAGKTPKISDLRKQCLKTKTTQKGGVQTTETEWDFGSLGRRTSLRFTEGKGKIKVDLEVTLESQQLFDNFTACDLDTISCQLIRVLKKQGREAAFYADGHDLTLTLKYRDMEKQFKVDLKARYESQRDKITSYMTKKYGGNMEDERDMEQVVDAGLFVASMTKNKGKNISEHLFFGMQRAIQHEFERISTVAGSAERKEAGDSPRVLKSKIERSGGELDALRYFSEGYEKSTFHWIEDTKAKEGFDLFGNLLDETPEDRVAKKQLLEKLIRDDKDRIIIELSLKDATKSEIAQTLSVTPAAISKRFNNFSERLREELKKQR